WSEKTGFKSDLPDGKVKQVFPRLFSRHWITSDRIKFRSLSRIRRFYMGKLDLCLLIEASEETFFHLCFTYLESVLGYLYLFQVSMPEKLEVNFDPAN
ncbi:7146_t:CDS:2, partial [Funneliformis mosseae]